ncbi:MAG TPA: AAA family ATPase [Alphaproteobacteria bacterium]|nr:AAA family ATPase [Alphaproteobacteria bacterium]
MSLIDDILKWSENELPLWQRDATRRLFQQSVGLTDNDYTELYSLLKAAYGLQNPANLKPIPLNSSHLPIAPPSNERVILKSMRDLKYVNRIAPAQVLDFAPIGITLIYGDNGTGKSGYSRVMKRACRSRDHSERVLTDVTDAKARTRIPEAIFDIEINSAAKSVTWIDGSTTPDELSTISVFDCHCARVYLTEEQDVAFLPYGLDIVESLANKVIPELSLRLENEISCIDVDRQPFNHLLGETEVGRLVAGLNANTDIESIKKLGNLSDEEKKRIEDLNTALSEVDPATKAKVLRLSAERLKELAKRIDNCLARVSDDNIQKIINLDADAIAACNEEKKAAEVLRTGGNLLPGTGEHLWKTLFEAAKKYSQVAYPTQSFPYLGTDAVCLLCQQPLIDVGDRIKRFDTYVLNDVAQIAKTKKQLVEATSNELKQSNLSFGLDKSLTDELRLIDEVAVNKINTFQENIATRKEWIISNIESHEWDSIPLLSENPRKHLRNMAAQQLKSARIFLRAANSLKKQELIKERNELIARQTLGQSKASLIATIQRMKLRKTLESCKNDLKTRSISDKSKVFARETITPLLKNALEEEFRALGIGHIKIKVEDRPEKGKIWYRLLLDLPSAHKLDNILSEGEQRAIALGSFLAELKLSNHSGGIIFDDPVSSLDHKHRGRFAKRIASEAQKRQVIIFTHDVVFLSQIRSECAKLNINPLTYFLEENVGFFGNVAKGLPWMHKSFGERIDQLEKAHKALEKLPWPASPSEELAGKIIRQYSFLRATIERIVQDLILNGTVQRFRDYIEVKKLDQVVGLERAVVDEVFRLYKRCNDIIEAHDPASVKNDPPPTPDELKNDIKDLKYLIEKVQEKHKSNKS